MQHPDETPIEYLRRIVHNLDYEQDSLLHALPSISSIIEYFELWSFYDTDLMVGIIECIEEGEDATPYNNFVLKYNLPWALYKNNEWEQRDELVGS